MFQICEIYQNLCYKYVNTRSDRDTEAQTKNMLNVIEQDNIL